MVRQGVFVVALLSVLAAAAADSDHGQREEQQPRAEQTRAPHWSVLAQQIDRRLPASHSASWK